VQPLEELINEVNSDDEDADGEADDEADVHVEVAGANQEANAGERNV